MAVLISDSHHRCFLAFEQLVDALQHPARDLGDQIPLKDVQEEFGKYKIWAGNVGAAHSGKRYEISLDYRLREASFLRHHVLRLLKTLNEKLENASSLVCGRRTPFEEYVEDSAEAKSTSSPSEADREEEDAQDSPWDISSSSSGDNDNTQGAKKPAGSSDLAPGPIAKLGQLTSQELPRLLASIKFVISNLYRIPIRKPAPFDRLRDKKLLKWSYYQHFDVLYIRDKFPLIDFAVASRLGKMITRRRELLYYRRTHNENLDTDRSESKLSLRTASTSKMSEKGVTTMPPQAQPGSQVAMSKQASSHFTLHSKATTSQPRLPLPPTQENLDTMALYAPSAADTKTSMASSFAGKELQIEIPPRPTDDSGVQLEWFQCPYCLISRHIPTDRKWK
ncbi:MAG: hypothetical protein LQ342_008398 [Letrouitia transgressa]|nr:MAG: hypothetical protein LQ342_008398 [Letrouitia transgressa]